MLAKHFPPFSKEGINETPFDWLRANGRRAAADMREPNPFVLSLSKD